MMSFLSPRTNRNAAESAVEKLEELGINFVALDFDCTVLDVHTFGRWEGTVEDLHDHIRPELKNLMLKALEKDIKLAIVTYSPQIHIVRGIVEHIVGPERVSLIPIRGGDKSWKYTGEGSMEGKQPFMASAVEELEQNGAIAITKATTVLIDDDRRNIRHALQDGVRAVWLNPEKPHRVLTDLGKLV